MSKFMKYLSIGYLKQHYKKIKYESKFKSQNLIVGIGTGLQNVNFGKNVFIGSNVQLNDTYIDDYSYVNSGAYIGHTRIGKFCSIASGVKISLGVHPMDFVSLHPAFYANNKGFDTFSDRTYIKEYANVEIGNDVWIGTDVMIPGGINVGDGAVIAAGAVVTKNVEPYSVVGGVPAKLIKYRFKKEVITKLLHIKWWCKDENWLGNNFLLFHDIEKFTSYFDIVEDELNND